MSVLISAALACTIIIGYGECTNSKTNGLEKTLFVPAITYPALVHLHSSGYSSDLLDNAAAYPRYIYNHNFNDYTDSLQKQPLHQDIAKRLENILHIGEDRKTTKNTETDEENYGKISNNVFYQEDTKPELEELDRRYRRSNIHVPSFLPRTTSNQKIPFGPYTTWQPYEGPISRITQNNQYARIEDDPYPRNTDIFAKKENDRA